MKLIYSVAFGVASFFALNCGSGDEGGGYSSSSGAPSAPPAASTGSSTSPNEPNVVEVKVNGHDFDPPEVRIKANQTVRWVWVSGRHNVVSGEGCSSDGRFSSGATATSTTFEHKFDGAGSFPYFCDPHCSIGMKGLVVVE